MLVERKTKNFPSTYNHKVTFKDLQRLIGSQSESDAKFSTPNNPKELLGHQDSTTIIMKSNC